VDNKKNIPTSEAYKYIDQQVLETYKLEGPFFSIEKIKAIELITFNRLDLVIRFLFVKSICEKNIINNYGKFLYYEFLRNCGSKKDIYFLDGDGRKNSFQDYYFNFINIINDMRKNEFDFRREAVTRARGMLLGGSHRVAAAAYYDKEVYCVDLVGNTDKNKWDYLCLQKIGLNSTAIEHIILNYIKIKKNCHILYFFPEGIKNIDFHKKIVEKYANLLYRKKIDLTRSGADELIKICYSHNNWWSDELLSRFRNERFENLFQVEIFFIEIKSDDDNCVKIKKEIRDHSKSVFCTVHSTDSSEECLKSSYVLLNNNSIYYLNHQKKVIEKNSEYMINLYKNRISVQNSDDYALDTGSVLYNFGIRPLSDVDYLCSNIIDSVVQDEVCSRHNADHWNLGLNPFETVEDPSCYFYYNGLKHVTLSSIVKFKLMRGAQKDIDDVRLIIDFLSYEKSVKFEVFSKKNTRRYEKKLKGIEYRLKKMRLVQIIRRLIGKKN
jgi:hypothetical protein